MAKRIPSILLVDDEQKRLDDLVDQLHALVGDDVEVKEWCPVDNDSPTRCAFDRMITCCPTLVVTDYDLTTSINGFFGSSIVAWCQSLAIPVGEFSRIVPLPREPNLFELRVPLDEEQAAKFIDNVFRGFDQLRNWIEDHFETCAELGSLTAVLASALQSPQSEGAFAGYTTELGASNSALLDQIAHATGDHCSPPEEKQRLLIYVLGHVLVNAVLRYPGPIVSLDALCAYLGTDRNQGDTLADSFAHAKYTGPFGHSTSFFWRDGVDSILDDMAQEVEEDKFESFAEYHRGVLEAHLKRKLDRHSCDRCNGSRGGFWCPFTKRTVCEREDCSVSACSWIPAGAYLCRVEKDFYDEWAPMLGY